MQPRQEQKRPKAVADAGTADGLGQLETSGKLRKIINIAHRSSLNHGGFS